MELQIVRISKYFPSRTAFDSVHETRAFAKSRSKNLVLPIGLSFRKRGNGEPGCRRTAPQSPKLRKNEPHPVTLLLSSLQLCAHLFENRVLRFNKSRSEEHTSELQ